MKAFFGVAFISIAVLAVALGLWIMSMSNSEIKLRNTVVAQQTVCNAYFDKMFKVLEQKAGVTSEYKEAFKEIYAELIEGRYQDQNLLFKFITESNPTFDPSLYKDLMASIEAERNGFLMEQKKLIDMDREHKTMRQILPASLFIGSRPDVGIVVITSKKTKETYESGEENDVTLFKR